MQLISISALSAFVIATAGSVQAVPAHDANNLVQRASSHHRAVARDVRAAAKARAAVPPTLKKRSSVQKRCRLRTTSTSTVVATATSSVIPDATATIDGVDDSSHHHHSSGSGSGSASSSSSAAPAATSSTPSNGSPWSLTTTRQGSNFFDNWTFWSDADPTHGNVEFLDAATAWNEGLVSINSNGQAVMSANTDDNVGNRKSIRIQDNYTFNINTLILMDATHMPTGCGTWPAFWSDGPNWPSGGEIDIVEGVNGQTQNQGTLHTDPGCNAGTDGTNASGQLTNASCGSSDGDNTGCGFTDTTSDNSFGADFNSANGGVYAMEWSTDGISMWFFARSAIPSDITSNQPIPSSWQAPFGHWPASSCAPDQYFNNNNAIFDLTFCGDWAGSAWASSGCADSTGYSSCSDYVSAVGSGFKEAYWEINSVKYFTSS